MKEKQEQIPSVTAMHVVEESKTDNKIAPKRSPGFFMPQYLQNMANQLLLQVMHADQDEVEKMLRINPELLTMPATATDYSGRTYDTTAFIYALWALDTRYMCNMMLDCLPDTLQGAAIQWELQKQYDIHERGGVTYKLNNKTIHESHYDFSPLTEALQFYIDHWDGWFGDHTTWYSKDYGIEGHHYWAKVVGGAQRYVPAHIAQHYCSTGELFDPESGLKKKFHAYLKYDDYPRDCLTNWYEPISATSTTGLGVDVGISRGRVKILGNACGYWSADKTKALKDLNDLNAFRAKRMEELNSLKQRLNGSCQKQDIASSLALGSS